MAARTQRKMVGDSSAIIQRAPPHFPSNRRHLSQGISHNLHRTSSVCAWVWSDIGDGLAVLRHPKDSGCFVVRTHTPDIVFCGAGFNELSAAIGAEVVELLITSIQNAGLLGIGRVLVK